MAPMFSALYDPVVEEWIQETQAQLPNNIVLAIDPVDNTYLEVGTTLYADDIKEINKTATDTELDQVIDTSTQILNEHLTPVGIAQNMDKSENMPCFMTKGAKQFTRKAQDRSNHPGKGKTVYQLKYLGNISTESGRTAPLVQARIQCTQENYYSFKGFWPLRNVPLFLKRKLFINVVGQYSGDRTGTRVFTEGGT